MVRAMSACSQWGVPSIPRYLPPRWWERCLSLWFQLWRLPVVHTAQASSLQWALSLNSYLRPIISNALPRSIFFSFLVPSLPWIRGHWRWTRVAYIQIKFSQWLLSVHYTVLHKLPLHSHKGVLQPRWVLYPPNASIYWAASMCKSLSSTRVRGSLRWFILVNK